MDLMLSSFFACFHWDILIMIILGVCIGLWVGILPGIGSTSAMALTIPFTWKMGLFPTFSLLAAIWGTSKFGGSLTSILFGIPGDVPNVSTVLDGFPMAKNGKARTAIAITSLVSIWGGIFSAFSVIILMPFMHKMIMLLGPAEYFMLAFFGLTLIASVSGKSVAKGLLAGCVGILISTIGFHPLVGQARYSLGSLYLREGISVSCILLGLLALREAITIWAEEGTIAGKGVALSGSYKEGVRIVFRNFPLIIRSSFIAWVVGIAPGAGATTSGLVSYASAAKTCKNPKNFGNGDPRGLVAADTALHSCAGGDFLPTITLGIPGSSSMAILLGAFLLHGLLPGPQIIKNNLDLIYFFLFVLMIAHILGVVILLPAVGQLEKLTKVRSEIIGPTIAVLCLIGAYTGREYWQDVFITCLFGILGYYMRKYDYSCTPMVLGVVLGPMCELSFFEALSFSDNGILTFFTRIPSLIIFCCILVLLTWPYFQKAMKS